MEKTLRFNRDLRFDPEKGSLTVEAILRTDSRLRAFRQSPGFQELEERERRLRLTFVDSAIREFAAQLGGIILEMQHHLEAGDKDRAYAAFLDYLGMMDIQASAFHEARKGREGETAAMGKYLSGAGLLTSGIAEAGFRSPQELIQDLEQGSEHPARRALAFLQRIYREDFWTDEERLSQIPAAGMEEIVENLKRRLLGDSEKERGRAIQELSSTLRLQWHKDKGLREAVIQRLIPDLRNNLLNADTGIRRDVWRSLLVLAGYRESLDEISSQLQLYAAELEKLSSADPGNGLLSLVLGLARLGGVTFWLEEEVGSSQAGKDFDAAETALAIAVGDPEVDRFAGAWFALGTARGMQGKWAEAEEALSKVVRLNPENPDAWYGLGIARGNQGKWAEAEKALSEATRLNPENPEAWYEFGIARGHQEKFPEAEKALSEAVRLNPEDPEAWFALGTARGMQGKWAEAEEALSKAVRLNPENPDAWYGLGIARGNQGKFPEAEEALLQALRLASYNNRADLVVEIKDALKPLPRGEAGGPSGPAAGLEGQEEPAPIRELIVEKGVVPAQPQSLASTDAVQVDALLPEEKELGRAVVAGQPGVSPSPLISPADVPDLRQRRPGEEGTRTAAGLEEIVKTFRKKLKDAGIPVEQVSNDQLRNILSNPASSTMSPILKGVRSREREKTTQRIIAIAKEAQTAWEGAQSRASQRPPEMEIHPENPSPEILQKIVTETIRAVHPLALEQGPADLRGVAESARSVNPRFGESFTEAQLRIADVEFLGRFASELSWRIFFPAGRLFGLDISMREEPQAYHYLIREGQWRRIPYLGTTVWEADASRLQGPSDNWGLSMGRFAVVDPAGARQSALPMYDLIMASPPHLPFSLQHLGVWLSEARIDRNAYARLLGELRLRFEERRHAQDHAYAELRFGSSPSRVGDFRLISYRIQHAGEDLEAQILLVA